MVALTHGQLPVLLARPVSAMVAVSSAFGLFAVRGFTESLRHGLAGRVGVVVVHPTPRPAVGSDPTGRGAWPSFSSAR